MKNACRGFRPALAEAIGSIPALLQQQATHLPQRSAILGGERASLTYVRLWEQFCRGVQALQAHGLKRGDRVAIVLPNGPDMAVTFLAASGVATAAPLNPAYRERELEFYLSDLDARAVIVDADVAPAAQVVAERRGIPVLHARQWMERLSAPVEDDQSSFHAETISNPDDVALVLHTSGTTSRPKMVPLTQRNLMTSAANIVRSLALTVDDRCLNVMPLFHIHGLVASVLSSLTAGGSVVCSEGFDVERFDAQLTEFQPTWYTAVPTIHQAVIAACREDKSFAAGHALRFVRSCSSALPPTVMQDIQQGLGVPIVEAYGMTEAAHQMTCNPLPPADRKPASVGIPTGVDVAIMDENGDMLPVEQAGEVVIRGQNVTLGYAHNEEANAQSFTNGWFRTGDQGYFDEQGYLYLTGRLKEMINRGGENISPREIDEVLLEHPAVAQAITFAVPHPTLGENVAAAVVPAPHAKLDVTELRVFVARRLSDHKVPQQIVVVDEIPKGPTGKPQRIGLADKLGLLTTDGAEAAPPVEGDSTVPRLQSIWSEILGRSDVRAANGFFELGGDSLRATQMLARVRDEFEIEADLRWVFESPTLEDLASQIDRALAAQKTSMADGSTSREAA